MKVKVKQIQKNILKAIANVLTDDKSARTDCLGAR